MGLRSDRAVGLQGMFNLRYVTRDTLVSALPAILALCVLLALLAGAAFRRRWAYWIYVGLTIVGVIIFVLRFAGGAQLGKYRYCFPTFRSHPRSYTRASDPAAGLRFPTALEFFTHMVPPTGQ